MKTEQVNISEVKPNPNNPRIIKDDKFAKLVQSIKDFPKMLEIRPIVVNADMIVLGGNMRLKACKEAGLKKVHIIKADELTEEQQREFIVKDNVSGGEWDWNMLANEWDVEQLDAWGLDVPDFTAEEIEAEEDDFDTTPPIEAVTVLGDLYEIGEHRLLCGDSTDIEKVEMVLNGAKADLLTDPPYGININMNMGRLKGQPKKFEEKDWDKGIPEFFGILPLFNKQIIWGGNYFADRLTPTKDWLCWYKKTKGLDFAEFELAWTNCGMNGRLLEHHWSGEKKLHPTMKPVPVISWCIEYLDSDVIFDLFLGSGSTMVASHQLKRKCYGMELDPKYCDVIVRRMVKLEPTLSVKRNGVDCKQEFVN
jgi:hypothetical protein